MGAAGQLEPDHELDLRDGEPIIADDVVSTVNLGKMDSVPYHSLWHFLAKAEKVNDRTARFTFNEPRYQQWANWIYFNPIVPKHLWQNKSEKDVTAARTRTRDKLGLDVKPKYLIDLVNTSNEDSLRQLLEGDIDLSNNFLPGIVSLVKGDYKLRTFYPDPPYMLPANTTWMVPNTTRKPRPAADLGQVRRQVRVGKYGFGFDTAKAKRILAQAGYRDRRRRRAGHAGERRLRPGAEQRPADGQHAVAVLRVHAGDSLVVQRVVGPGE